MDKKRLDFGNGRVGALFRALFFPTLVGMFFNSALNICDGMFVGHGVGSDALAAINIVAPVFLLCTGVGLMFGIGASVVASIRLAEGKVQAARTVMTQAFLTGAVIFSCVILVSLLFTGPLLSLMGCSERLEPYARDYLLWLLPGLMFLYVQCVGMMLVRLDGAPKYAMTVQIVAAVLNIFLDWLMVFPLGMGIGGAAMATSASCAVGGLMVLVYFLFFSDKLKFSREVRTGALRNVANMARVGAATFLAELAIGVMMVTGNYMYLRYLGEDGVAAFSIACYLFPLVFSISNAVAQSAQPIISYNYGAGRPDRVRAALHIALGTAAVCGVLVTLGMWRVASVLAGVFLPSDTAAYGMACSGLPVFGMCAMFFAVNITFIGYYQSVENAVASTLYTLLRGIVFPVAGFVLLPATFGASGLWYAIPLAEALTMLAILIQRFPRRGWH